MEGDESVRESATEGSVRQTAGKGLDRDGELTRRASCPWLCGFAREQISTTLWYRYAGYEEREQGRRRTDEGEHASADLSDAVTKVEQSDGETAEHDAVIRD